MDAVITYVECDKNFEEQYEKYVKKDFNASRYRSYHVLDLQIKLIRKYMSYIKNIFVVVNDKSQVEEYDDLSGAIIVEHSQIIPPQYLPCFNSCTIEMFLHNIPNLAEQFIYFNDDMFVINKVSQLEFFKGSQPVLNPKIKDIPENPNLFEQQCINSTNEILKKLKKENSYSGKYFAQEHICKPYLKRTFSILWSRCKDDITYSLTRTRHRKNFNCYLFNNYDIVSDNYVNKKHDYKYIEIDTTPINIKNIICKANSSFLCINDNGVYHDFNEIIIKIKEALLWHLTKTKESKYIEEKEVFTEIVNENIIEENTNIINKQLNEKLIVSLTSYPARIKYVKSVLESLVNQDISHDLYHIVLVLSLDEFPNKEKNLPKELISYIKENKNLIEIIWDIGNIKSHKKLMPTLKKYPNNSILICDDDVYRPVDWIKMFIKDHIKYPNDIITGVAKSYLSYDYNKYNWHDLTSCLKTNAGNFCNHKEIIFNTLRPANGFGGTLYPPNTFTDKRFFNRELFMSLSPTSDEMWQWTFNIIENKTIRQSSQIFDYSKYFIKDSQKLDTCLWKVNNGKKYNDILNLLTNTFNDFKIILDKKLNNNIFNTKNLGKYCICSITNDDFVPGLMTMIYSFLKHNIWFSGDIIILYSNTFSPLSKENIDKLSLLYDNIKFININEEKYNKIDFSCIPKKFISPLIKFEIFGLEEYNKVLYIDADTLIVNDMFELINLNNDIIVFPHESFNSPGFINWKTYEFKTIKQRCINNGVIMLNKNIISKDNLNTLLNISYSYNKKLSWYKGCPDQDIMQKFLEESTYEVIYYKNQFNTIKRVFKNQEKINLENISLIHYVMKKPWIENEEEFIEINKLWFKYYNELKNKNFVLKYEKYKNSLYEFCLENNIKINLNNPTTIQDKINWLKIYDSTPLKTKCSDKILVHEYCKEKIGEDICLPIFKVYDNYKQIRYNKLPDKFVMKCNHGSGWNKIVTDKKKMNGDDLYFWINKWLKTDWSEISGFEMQYKDIQPKILVEYYMEDTSQKDSLLDYKFWCFNGEPKFYTINGNRGHGSINHYTLDNKLMDLSRADYPKDKNVIYNIPKNYNKMIEYAKILSKDFLFVRVDFYEINDKLYLGELTFTPGSGIFKYQNSIDNTNIGNLLILPNK